MGQKMNGENINTVLSGFLGTMSSFLILHIPEIQAFITFCLTVLFLFYKIREARARAIVAEKEVKK